MNDITHPWKLEPREIEQQDISLLQAWREDLGQHFSIKTCLFCEYSVIGQSTMESKVVVSSRGKRQDQAFPMNCHLKGNNKVTVTALRLITDGINTDHAHQVLTKCSLSEPGYECPHTSGSS